MNTYGFLRWLSGEESACQCKRCGFIPGWGRSPGGGNGNPLQYSCLENPMDRGAWQAIVHEVARVGHDLLTKPPPCIIKWCVRIYLSIYTIVYITNVYMPICIKMAYICI